MKDLQRAKKAEFLLPVLLEISEEKDEEELRKYAADINLIQKDSEHFFCVTASKYRNKENIICTDRCHIEFTDGIFERYFLSESFYVNHRIITFITDENKNKLLEKIRIAADELVKKAKLTYNQTCVVGISRLTDLISQCANARFQAITAGRYTSDGAGNVRFIDDQEHGEKNEFEYIRKSVYTLEDMLKVGTEEEITDFINGLYEYKDNNMEYLIIQLLATIHRSIWSVNDASSISDFFNVKTSYEKIFLKDSNNDTKSEMIQMCLSARNIIAGYRKRDTEILCDKVIEIIENEYSNEKLSLTNVSNRLNVSPNYLSSLIKKVKKANFTSLLTEKRMKVAYNLILCTSKKVMEISSLCGYSDQHYFSSCFKKYYGESPNKFRENRH